MPSSCLLVGLYGLFLTAADPAPVRIVIEEDRSPAALATKASTPEPGALRPEPSQRFQQEQVLSRLKIQASLREAAKLLAERKFQPAIELLEPGLLDASGSVPYLMALEAAYRGRISELLTSGKSEAARVFAERLRVLSPIEAEAALAVASVAAFEPAVAKQTTTEAAAPSATQPANPIRGADFKARAKLDQTESNGAFEKAETLFEQKRYAEALPFYEKAYEMDPVAVQAGRERWGYCLLYVSVDRYNHLVEKDAKVVEVKAWTDLEGDVRLARRLAPGMDYCDTVLGEINKQIETRRKTAVAPKDALSTASADQPAAKSPTPAVGRYSQTPLKDVPSRSFRHLPGRSQSWSVVETANFRIYHRDPALAEEVAQLAEDARVHGHEMWFSSEPMEAWTPACEIYLYPTSHEYSQATGVSAQSPGHTKVVPDNGRIVSRMVCLRTDDPNMKHAVLPHEITHVVLAGRFGSHSLPRWADEGMAVLTEPRNKQDSHLANLSQSRRNRRGFGCAQLLTMGDYPGGGQMLDFYAHSVGICRLLVEKGGNEKLVQFLRQSLQSGNYETALHNVYGIDFNSLETEFNQFVAGLGSTGVQTASAAR